MTAPTTSRAVCDPATLAEECGDCGRTMHRGEHARMCRDGHPRHSGQGRCGTCASSRRYRALCAPARRTWRRDDLLEEWAALRGSCTFEDFPTRVGISYQGWERAYYRARAAGDPRAVRVTQSDGTWRRPIRSRQSAHGVRAAVGDRRAS